MPDQVRHDEGGLGGAQVELMSYPQAAVEEYANSLWKTFAESHDFARSGESGLSSWGMEWRVARRAF